jgi:tRNA(Ile2) C34 agmatinyltransferase TiaS
MAFIGDEIAGCAPAQFIGSSAVVNSTKRVRILNIERPHCPECGMRMIAISPPLKKFECLRCGYAGSAIKRDAAE